MKLNDLVHILETGSKSVSEAKVKVANLLQLNEIEFDSKIQKKIDSVINHINKMTINVYTGIKYKIPYNAYSDDKPLFVGELGLKEGYNLDTEVSKCLGILDRVAANLDGLGDVTQVIDGRSNSIVKIKKTATTSRLAAIKALKEVRKGLDGIGAAEEEVAEEE